MLHRLSSEVNWTEGNVIHKPGTKKAESSKAGEGIITLYNKYYVQY